MKLSIANIEKITPGKKVNLPDAKLFELPEKVLQFGTGVFIRGLIDYIIDRSNKQGEFNGRVVMVKSTDTGDIQPFKDQDNLYTLVMKSVDGTQVIEERVICTAISRILNARDEWEKVLACAYNPELSIIISNTTEGGIVMVENDSITLEPPQSYPAKLLSFLNARFQACGGSPDGGLVILPTELIPDNATILKEILNKLAVQNNLSKDFIFWLNVHNDFCNTLVDRIVPGVIAGSEKLELEKELGYNDDLMIMGETFGLWAIETISERSKEIMSFSKAFENVYVVPNIDKFRELKLRLLNGSHNLSCAIGVVAGFKTVKEAMADPIFDAFMQKLINQEIAMAIVSDEITLADAQGFGTSVLQRYRNPFIEFDWLSICVQDTAKIRIRAVPIVIQHYEKYGYVPNGVCLGFAAYILYMKGEIDSNEAYKGLLNGRSYTIDDDFAKLMSEKWGMSANRDELVISVLKDRILWGDDLSELKGFCECVSHFLTALESKGFFETIKLV
nr:tagaturonate reductase [Pedobacter panaciterrae]